MNGALGRVHHTNPALEDTRRVGARLNVMGHRSVLAHYEQMAESASRHASESDRAKPRSNVRRLI
jgi:hypothetical protein